MASSVSSASSSLHEKEANLPSASSSFPSSEAAAAAAKYDDDEEEEDVCRICRNPADPEHPLRYPCACSGSIKYVHQECLLQWLNHSNARQCEVRDYHSLSLILFLDSIMDFFFKKLILILNLGLVSFGRSCFDSWEWEFENFELNCY